MTTGLLRRCQCHRGLEDVRLTRPRRRRGSPRVGPAATHLGNAPSGSRSDERGIVGGKEIRVARQLDRVCGLPAFGERVHHALPAGGALPGAVDQDDVAHRGVGVASGWVIVVDDSAAAPRRSRLPLGAERPSMHHASPSSPPPVVTRSGLRLPPPAQRRGAPLPPGTARIQAVTRMSIGGCSQSNRRGWDCQLSKQVKPPCQSAVPNGWVDHRSQGVGVPRKWRGCGARLVVCAGVCAVGAEDAILLHRWGQATGSARR